MKYKEIDTDFFTYKPSQNEIQEQYIYEITTHFNNLVVGFIFRSHGDILTLKFNHDMSTSFNYHQLLDIARFIKKITKLHFKSKQYYYSYT